MNHVQIPSGSGPTALLNPDWWEWNERVWGVRASEFEFRASESSDTHLRGAFFTGPNGKAVTPPLMPHIPLGLSGSAGSARRVDSLTREWITLADQFAQELVSKGISNAIVLPSGFLDGRPFAWAGLTLGISYTYVAPLPHALSMTGKSVRAYIRKAPTRGYSVGRSDDWAGIASCLRATEVVKGFRHRLSEHGMQLGERLLGSDSFRGYIVRNAEGRAVAGSIHIHVPGHQAVGLVSGGDRAAMRDGVSQLIDDFVMTDLHEAGATSYDMAGANTRGVAHAKASWGYPLSLQLKISQGGVMREIRSSLARHRSLRSLRYKLMDARGV